MNIYRPLNTLQALQRCAQCMGMAVVPLNREQNAAFVLVNDDRSHYMIGGADELRVDQVRTALMWMYEEWSDDRHTPADYTKFD